MWIYSDDEREKDEDIEWGEHSTPLSKTSNILFTGNYLNSSKYGKIPSMNVCLRVVSHRHRIVLVHDFFVLPALLAHFLDVSHSIWRCDKSDSEKCVERNICLTALTVLIEIPHTKKPRNNNNSNAAKKKSSTLFSGLVSIHFIEILTCAQIDLAKIQSKQTTHTSKRRATRWTHATADDSSK